MKRISCVALSLAILASPAFALKITNLDTVAHRVELSGRGEPEVRLIQPNATENFFGAAQGFLALVPPEEVAVAEQKSKKKSRKKRRETPASTQAGSVVNADGILSGIIGNGRTSRIPADPDHSYTIWPAGKLTVQGRMKRNGYR
jgi:hypothetical protein